MSISRHLDEYVEQRSITVSDAVVPERCQEFTGEVVAPEEAEQVGVENAAVKSLGADSKLERAESAPSLEDAAVRVACIMQQ